MDRRWALTALFVGASLSAASAPIPIREAAWIAPGHRVEALTRKPGECLHWQGNLAQVTMIALGRTAFHAPTLLGGQAARAGISCESCHRNGHGNPHFLFPGVSRAPGTADVTSSLFSSHRGDHIFNPKRIPDLTLDPPKVTRDPASPTLRKFIRGLIVEEFDGAEPPPLVLDGLVAYVRALDARQCPPGHKISAASLFEVARLDAGMVSHAAMNGDKESARIMFGAARSILGKIDERLPKKSAVRPMLLQLDRDALSSLEAIDMDDPQVAGRLADWQVSVYNVSRRNDLDAKNSLFNPAKLRAAVGD